MLREYALSLPHQSILIGWSLGGLVAIDLCVNFPDYFPGLILLGSTPRFLADTNWSGVNDSAASQLRLSLRTNHEKFVSHFISLTSFPAKSFALRNYFHHHFDTSLTVDQQSNYLDYLFTTDLRDSFYSLQLPKMVVCAEKDAIVADNQCATHYIKNAGHAFFATHTDMTCKWISQFAGNRTHEAG